jgi:protein NrfD
MAQSVTELPDSAPTKRFKLLITDAFWILGLLLIIAGAWTMWQRFTFGLGPTNLTSYVPWGLWVGFYDFLVWIEVGSLMLFTGMVYLAGYKRLARMKSIVLFTGFAVLVMALFIVLMDLGRPERFWHVLLYPDFGSMITWMVWLHSAYLLVLSAELLLVIFGGERGEKPLKILALLSLPMGLALILVSGSIFGVIAARPLWNTASLPLMFLVSALAVGSSLLLLLTTLFWPEKKSEDYRIVVRHLATITGWLLLVGVLAASVIGITILYKGGGSPARVDALMLILTGPYWWSFWILHIVLGVLVPLLIHFTIPHKPVAVGIAALLSVVTFVAVTLNIVIPVLVTPELQGLATAFSDPKLDLNYVPNTMEWLIIGFIFGLGGLIYGLGLRFLPVWPKKDGDKS